MPIAVSEPNASGRAYSPVADLREPRIGIPYPPSARTREPEASYVSSPERSAIDTDDALTGAAGHLQNSRQEGASWERLYARLQSAVQVRHYSPKTLRAYRAWVRKFQAYTKSKDPKALSMVDVRDFLSFLATHKKVSASSQNQAFNALLFLFKHVLEKEFKMLEGVVMAKRRPYIPVVLSREEVDSVIAQLSHPEELLVNLLYGCGLRLFEGLKLRVQDLNFDMKVLTVHDGKGKKDRTVPMPDTLIPRLKSQLETVVQLHQMDLAAGYSGTFLPDRIEEKYKNAARELVWQWFFPPTRRRQVFHSAFRKLSCKMKDGI